MNKEELTERIELLCDQLGLAIDLRDLDLAEYLLGKLKDAMYQLEEMK